MQELITLLGKKHIVLTSSCNKAILEALKIAKERGHKVLNIPNQGAWKTYFQFGKKLGFEILEIPTNRGVIDFTEVKEGVVIFHTLPGYSFFQKKYDYSEMKRKEVFVIADVCGSIGQKVVDCDIVVCSFGRENSAKILDARYGGCIACDNLLRVESDYEGDEDDIKKAIYALPKRIVELKRLRDKVMEDLSEFVLVSPDEEGFNVFMKKSLEVTRYCEKHDIGYRECPLRTRILEEAISVEIKAKRL